MTEWIRILLEILEGIPSKEAVIFLISTLPVLELRGGLLAASLFGIDMVRAVMICVAGCFFPVPFILLLIRRVLQMMKEWKLTEKIAWKLEEHALEKSDQIGMYEFWGLLVFVAVPLPGTGAWTGALVASLLGMQMRKAMPAIFCGVLISAAMMAGVAYGVPNLIF